MVKLFIIVRKRGTKTFKAAFAARKGTTMKTLRSSVLKQIGKGFVFKIVTFSQLKRIIERHRPRRRVVRSRKKKR